MRLKKIVLPAILSTLLSGCALWPYEKKFDCPLEEGPRCKSLYEISEMADKGMFGPNAKRQEVEELKQYRKAKKAAKPTKKREYCNGC